jgi:hypothetical protein
MLQGAAKEINYLWHATSPGGGYSRCSTSFITPVAARVSRIGETPGAGIVLEMGQSGRTYQPARAADS